MSQKRVGPVQLRDSGITEPKEQYLESPVRFSFSKCSIDKKHCIRYLDDHEISRLYKTIGNYENHTWKQFWSLVRAKGMTPEIEGTPSYSTLKTMRPELKDFGHFRVDGCDNPFRVFAGKGMNGLLYLVLFDKQGNIHH